MALREEDITHAVSATRVADQIVATLHAAGVRVVFGVPGGAIAPIFDALIDEPRIRVVNANHESTAVYAAAAHARATGTVGVVLVTSGPGVTNALTGLASAHCDGLPVLLIGGEVARKNFGRGALQEGSPYHLNLVAMAKHITKLSVEVVGADQAIFTIRKALATAQSGRKGPVFLSLPLDVQGAKTVKPQLAHQTQAAFEVDASMVDMAVHQLLTSDRPLVLAGSGTRWNRGPQELLNFAERYNIPVMTTPKAKGVFPESHPLSLGVYGLGGHPAASNYLRSGVDLLLAVGTSFNDVATNSWNTDLKVENCIQVDIEGSQIGRNYPAGIGLVGDAGTVLAKLAVLAPKVLPHRKLTKREWFTDPSTLTKRGPIKPQRALWELQQLLPSSAIYTCDIGDHSMFALHYLSIDAPDGFHFACGLGSMGSGIASAIGVKLAHPDRPVVAICGDGTLTMSGMDVALAVKERLNIIYCVLNDRRYGMVEAGHEAIFGRTPPYPVSLAIGELASALHAEVVQIDEPEQITALGTRRLLNSAGPLVLDVHVDALEKMPRLSRFDAIREGAVQDAPKATPPAPILPPADYEQPIPLRRIGN